MKTWHAREIWDGEWHNIMRGRRLVKGKKILEYVSNPHCDHYGTIHVVVAYDKVCNLDINFPQIHPQILKVLICG